MTRKNPHKELGSFKKFSPPRTKPPHEEHTIQVKFFMFYEYAHQNYKDKNPYKKEFIDFVDSIDINKEDRAQFIYVCFQLYKKQYTQPINPGWQQNRPIETKLDAFKDL